VASFPRRRKIQGTNREQETNKKQINTMELGHADECNSTRLGQDNIELSWIDIEIYVGKKKWRKKKKKNANTHQLLPTSATASHEDDDGLKCALESCSGRLLTGELLAILGKLYIVLNIIRNRSEWRRQIKFTVSVRLATPIGCGWILQW